MPLLIRGMLRYAKHESGVRCVGGVPGVSPESGHGCASDGEYNSTCYAQRLIPSNRHAGFGKDEELSEAVHASRRTRSRRDSTCFVLRADAARDRSGGVGQA